MKRWLTLLLIVAAALALVVAPVWLIHPFKPQTARSLEAGYELRRWSPWVTPVLLLAGLAVVAFGWRRTRRWWSKALMIVMLIPLAASAWFARQNHFEWMFNPLAGASYAAAPEASFVRGDDMVLAVSRGGDAVAYPVRLMAYHHLVGDTVGGVPVVATY